MTEADDGAVPQGGSTRLSTLMGPTNDLADDEPKSRLDRILQWVPRVLSSKPHVLALMGLGVYLIVLPLVGVTVSSNAELIGGNYTNVTSDIGACIAAGGTLHLVAQGRKRRKIEDERLRLAQETHRLLHYVYGDAARELGHLVVAAAGPGHGQPPFRGQGRERPDGDALRGSLLAGRPTRGKVNTGASQNDRVARPHQEASAGRAGPATRGLALAPGYEGMTVPASPGRSCCGTWEKT